MGNRVAPLIKRTPALDPTPSRALPVRAMGPGPGAGVRLMRGAPPSKSGEGGNFVVSLTGPVLYLINVTIKKMFYVDGSYDVLYFEPEVLYFKPESVVESPASKPSVDALNSPNFFSYFGLSK